jgi:hypothetical protein
MKTNRILIIAAFAAVSASAFAGETDPFSAPQQQASHASRADVKAEVIVARSRGELPIQIESNWPSLQQSAAIRSRAEVKAEAIQAAMHHHFDPAESIN